MSQHNTEGVQTNGDKKKRILENIIDVGGKELKELSLASFPISGSRKREEKSSKNVKSSQVKMETLQNIRSVQRAVHPIKCFTVPEVKHETVCVTVPDDCVDVSYTLEELFCEIVY